MKPCSICGSKSEKLVNLGKQPLANKYPIDSDDAKNEKLWDMDVLICSDCRCAFLPTVIDRSEMFKDYYYLSSVNLELVKHFEHLASALVNSRGVVDIGSNDGVLLRPLRDKGVKAIGIDPSENVGLLANEEGLETLIGFFDEKIVERVKDEFGKPEHIIASSIFTHVEDPHSFVRNLVKLSDQDTKVIIEVEYLVNLIQNLQFERFYFDRPYYYSIQSMKTLFLKYGFNLVSVENITPHGGSLRLTFTQSPASQKQNKAIDDLIQKERAILSSTNVELFRNKIAAAVKELKNFLYECKKQNIRVAGYGAPARLATITNFADIGPELISEVFEDSKLKVKRLTPGKHIPISPSSELVPDKYDLLVVFAYEYIESIYGKTQHLRVPHYSPIPVKKLKG